jgi:DNA-binding PadR family transcriptional regulator
MFNDQTQHHHPYWLGRHHGGQGSGHFAGGFFGNFGRGGAGFRSGRKLGGPDLQLLILALLAEKPSHGYELIKALEDRSGGFYVPSPGMIYPALTYLEEIGYATVEAEGARKLYAITESGRRHLEENRETIDTMLEELQRVGARMEHVRRAFNGEDPRDERFAGETRELHTARRALKTAIHEKHPFAPEEAKRIAEILRRAAAEIAGK